jgi:hypothetical protein
MRFRQPGSTHNLFCSPWQTSIEDLCNKRQGIFDRKECGLFYDSRSKLKYHSAMADGINDTPVFYAGIGSGFSRGFRENEKYGP